jgi:hypothetical protein
MVEALVDIHGVIDHIRLGEKLDLGLQDLVVTVETFVLEELQEGEDEVTIEEGSDSGGKIILSHVWTDTNDRMELFSSSRSVCRLSCTSTFERASACVCVCLCFCLSRKETLIRRE